MAAHIISAKEAREILDKNIEEKSQEEFDFIMNRIHEAVSKSHSSITVNPIHRRTECKLEGLGYKIKTSVDPRESKYTISW